MGQETLIQKMYEEVKEMKADVNFIKAHMFDPDTIMSTEENKRFAQSMKEFKKGNTVSLAQLKKELKLS